MIARLSEEQSAMTAKPYDTLSLYRRLTEYFNEEELRDLCFRLDVDYDDLPGAGKAGKAA